MKSRSDIAETINNIIEKRGVSILSDQNLFCAILDDVIPLASIERNISSPLPGQNYSFESNHYI